jgi:hypothetical protein
MKKIQVNTKFYQELVLSIGFIGFFAIMVAVAVMRYQDNKDLGITTSNAQQIWCAVEVTKGDGVYDTFEASQANNGSYDPQAPVKTFLIPRGLLGEGNGYVSYNVSKENPVPIMGNGNKALNGEIFFKPVPQSALYDGLKGACR